MKFITKKQPFLD